MPAILVVSPDPASLGLLSAALGRAGFDVVTAPSCEDAVPTILRTRIDGAVLDSVPAQEASWLRDHIRQGNSSIPLLFLAPAGADWLPGSLPPLLPEDRVVSKPFSPENVVETLKEALQSQQGDHKTSRLAGLEMDTFSYRLSGNGLSVHLTPIEYKLLRYLAEKKGEAVSSQELLEKVWEFHPGTGSSEVVRAHMRNLRLKLRTVAPGSQLIETIPRRGYRLIV